MASPFFIKSKSGDLVIGLQDGSTRPGTLLDAFTRKAESPDRNYQLWEFVPSTFKGYSLLRNPASGLVIDIQGASTKPGTPLKAFTISNLGTPPLDTNSDHQVWEFVPSSEAGFYFIQSGLGDLVVDVNGAAGDTGAHLSAHWKKSSGTHHQLWTLVDEKGEIVTPPAPFVPASIK
jgi:hypothetical protein